MFSYSSCAILQIFTIMQKNFQSYLGISLDKGEVKFCGEHRKGRDNLKIFVNIFLTQKYFRRNKIKFPIFNLSSVFNIFYNNIN